MRRLLTALLWVAPLACKSQDPKDPETWIARLSDQDPVARAKATQELRRLKAKNAAPALVKALADPAAREGAATALGELGGPQSVQPLLDALDTNVGSGSDSATRAANRTNAKIAESLGQLGDAKAGPALLRLARAQDDSVRLAAIGALGQLRLASAVPELSHIVDGDAPPMVIKKAVVALGQIGDPRGIPALQHALVLEKQGVSFLPEASYALFQMGAPAVEPMLALARDQDAGYLAWAKEHSRVPAGTYAKAAIVLGDLGDLRAVPALLEKLKYKDSDPNPGTARLLSDKVREFAADALGRMRAKEAARPILELVKTGPDDGERVAFASNALVWIGDRTLAAELLKRAAAPGDFAARVLCAQAAALLGEPSLLPALKAAAAAKDIKPPRGDCASELAGMTGNNVVDEGIACRMLAQQRADAFLSLGAALEAAKACGLQASSSGCWLQKLAEQNPLVRARAAYELGRSGEVTAVPALIKAAGDADLHARIAAIRALEWLATLPAAQASLKNSAAQLATQLQTEQGAMKFYKVNEELRRLQARLARL